jgi:mannosyltransferase
MRNASSHLRLPLYLGGTIALVWLAFALRVYNLDSQSLWYDEGFSIWLARQDLATITHGDFNPPLHLYILHFWMQWAGQSELAARFLSVIFSTFSVLVTIRLGSRVFDRATGLVAGLIIAVAPFHLWYGQEVRMYALVTALSLLASVALYEALAGRRSVWPVYVGAIIAAVYTHYYAWMIVVAHAVFVVWWSARNWGRKVMQRAHLMGAVADRYTWPGPPRPLFLWIVSQFVLLIAIVPWLPLLREHYRSQVLSYWPGTLSLRWVAERVFTVFSAGARTADGAQLVTVVFLLLAGVGVLGSVLRDRRSLDGVFFTVAYLLIPILLLYLVVRDRPKFAPRYVLMAAPAFYLLAAAGLRALWPRRTDFALWRPIGVVAVVAALTTLLGMAYRVDRRVYFDPTYARDDFRGVANYLENQVGQDEAVLLLSGHSFPVFEYYYDRDNWFPIPQETNPSPSVIDPVTLEIAEELDRLSATYHGLWVVLWQDEVADPNGTLLALLDREAEALPISTEFHDVGLRHYRLSSDSFFGADIQHPLGVSPVPEVRLAGYDLLKDPTPADADVDLLFYWQALAGMDRNYKVSLRLLDSQGLVWASSDAQLAGFMYPTYRWSPGDVVLGRHRIHLPAGIQPLTYRLQMVFYGAEDTREPVEMTVGEIQVSRPAQPPTVDDLEIPKPVTAFFGGLELMGYSLSSPEMRPGSEVDLTLFWRAHQGPGIRRQLEIQLGNSVIPVAPAYPIEDWQAGDIFETRHHFRIPANDEGGVRSLNVMALDGAGEPVGPPAHLTDVTVQVADRLFEIPTISHPERVELGTAITYLGYDLEPRKTQPGDTLHLTLYWQSREPVDISYKVFVHLMNVGVGMWGQVDDIPIAGTRPTTGWLPGEVLTDKYDVTIHPGAPTGDYYIETGMYDPETMHRLPATAGGHLLAENRIVIDGIRIEE